MFTCADRTAFQLAFHSCLLFPSAGWDGRPLLDGSVPSGRAILGRAPNWPLLLDDEPAENDIFTRRTSASAAVNTNQVHRTTIDATRKTKNQFRISTEEERSWAKTDGLQCSRVYGTGRLWQSYVLSPSSSFAEGMHTVPKIARSSFVRCHFQIGQSSKASPNRERERESGHTILVSTQHK